MEIFNPTRTLKNPEVVVITGASAGVGRAAERAFTNRYPAENAFWRQQADQPVKPDRPDNLFESVEGGYEAHGRFDNEAKAESKGRVLSYYRDWILGGIAFLIFLILLFILI